jgi:predicted transcriptional regulator YheO
MKSFKSVSYTIKPSAGDAMAVLCAVVIRVNILELLM